MNSNGYEGYANINISLDVDQLIDDYSHKLNPKAGNGLLGADTPAIAAELAFDMYEPFDLEYEASEGLKNGDKIDITWDVNKEAVKTLQEYIDVDFKYSDFKFTVEGLQELRQVDPFENLVLEGYGVSGEATLNKNIEASIEVSEGKYQDFDIEYPKVEGVSNGDIIPVKLEREAEYFAKNYGIELTRTEADLVIETLDYYPTSSVVFDYCDEQTLENTRNAILINYKKMNSEVTAELVGMLYYYRDDADLEDYTPNANNQLVFIYHLEDGIYPGGWYSYVGPDHQVIIGLKPTEDGGKKILTTMEFYNILPDALGNYHYEYSDIYRPKTIPMTFEYGGQYYFGHPTLEECIEAIDKNLVVTQKTLTGSTIEKHYDHRIVSDEFKGTVSEW
jgi:hypothetical protein